MNVLAIDQATLSGWALLEGDELSSGVIPLPRAVPTKGPGSRFMAFDRELENRFGSFAARDLVVVHEQPFVSQQLAAIVIVAGLAMHIEAFCQRHGYERRYVHNMTVKKYATGRGHATKEAMLRNARLKWPAQEIIDHNQADALWILDYAIYGDQS